MICNKVYQCTALYSCMNIVFHVDGDIVFEVSFLEAYDCWAVFCNM